MLWPQHSRSFIFRHVNLVVVCMCMLFGQVAPFSLDTCKLNLDTLQIHECEGQQDFGIADSQLRISKRLAMAAKHFGCMPNRIQAMPDIERHEFEEELLSCVLENLYPADTAHFAPELGKAGTYGEILIKGVAAVFRTVTDLGSPLAADDSFFDFGSGLGKMVLQAHLTTDIGSSIGIELETRRHKVSAEALVKLHQETQLPSPKPHVGMVKGDVRNSEVWTNASIVYAASLCFPPPLMLEMSALWGKVLQPGAVVFSLKRLAGCHRRLRFLGTVDAPMTWQNEFRVFVYVAAPVGREMPQWLQVDAAQWQAQAEADWRQLLEREGLLQAGDNASMELPIARLVKCCRPGWGISAASVAARAFLAAGIVRQASSWPGAPAPLAVQPTEVVSLATILTATLVVLKGEEKSSVRCAYVQSEALKAAEKDDPEVELLAPWLLKLGDSVVGPGQTLAHLAASMRHSKQSLHVMKELIAQRAVSDGRDQEGRTAMRIAAEHGHIDMVKALVDARSDLSLADAAGVRPMDAATRWGHSHVAALLVLQPGQASPTSLRTAAEYNNSHVLRMLAEQRADVNSRTQDGMTALATAARKGHLSVASVLLDSSADIDGCDNSTGKAPLHYAVEKMYSNVVELLLARRADVNLQDAEGNTPLLFARVKNKRAPSDRVEITQRLLLARADPDARKEGESSLLQLQVMTGEPELLSLLLQHRAQVDQRDAFDATPLQVACARGHIDSVRLLMAYRAEPELTDKWGATPLTEAARSGSRGLEALKLLLEVPVRSKLDLALQLAARRGSMEAVQALLDARANVHGTDSAGEGPLTIAVRGGHEEVVSQLLEAGAGKSEKSLTFAREAAALTGHAAVRRLLMDRQ